MQPGGLFMVGFSGLRLSQARWLRQALRAQALGGVILFDRNVDGSPQNIVAPHQLAALTDELRSLRPDLLIAVDQEGGNVCRLRRECGFQHFPSARELGRAGLEKTSRTARLIALELSNFGVNCNLAPVVDLDLNPANPIIGRYGRSFHVEAEEVVRHARAFIDAHHGVGVGCCLKHFPGHGSARRDSHLGFVDITSQWHEEELAPFQQLIAQGYCDGIMTAHLVNLGLDSAGLPATLSRPVVQGLLREQMGFAGVIFSDDLQMRAITEQWSYRKAVQMALLAGVDMIIVGNNLQPGEDAVEEGVAAVIELLECGMITETRILESLARIRAFQQRCTGGAQGWTSTPPTT